MSDRSSVRILVLDDEPLMLEHLAETLDSLGYTQVSTCTSGYRALGLVDAPGADIILCDLRMPELDGVQFIRHLQARDFRGAVVLVSGVDQRIMQSTERLVRSYGVDILGSLSKPFLPQQLEHLLAQWNPARAASRTTDAPGYSAAELRAAVASSELINFYQPKVRVDTGAIVGAEVLVRWRHPVNGLLVPDLFIAAAEHHEIIEDLTCVVIRGALRQARDWRARGLDLELAINVSMDWLTDLEFPELVAGLASEAGAAPHNLMLEVAGSHLAADLRVGLEILTRLRLQGFGLSVSAFGADELSPAQLRDIPFSELKLDRAFVSQARRDPVAGAAFASGVALGRQLGVTVVAEGVENIDDWNFVRGSGCAAAQGYFVAEPMRAEALPGWAARWPQRFAGECAP